jgi:hypothetical protein
MYVTSPVHLILFGLITLIILVFSEVQIVEISMQLFPASYYSTISVIRHIWDQGTAGLPKTTDYWKKSDQIYYSNYII